MDAYVKGRKARPDAVYDYLLQYVDKESCVLDLACGTGVSTYPLFTRFQEVYACDHDSEMLQAARRDLRYSEFFQEGSAYDIPFAEEKFDLITIFSAFHWFCNEDAICEMARVLKKNGYIYSVQGGGSWLFIKEGRKLISSIVGHPLSDPKESFAPEKTLTENGFQIIAVKETVTDERYTIEEALQLFQSKSDWHYVKKAGKEEEVLCKLRELCEQFAVDGMVVNPTVTKSVLAQKQ